MDAIQTVFCQGDSTAIELLRAPLLVGKKLGKLPDGLSQLPLQKDIEEQQRKLRLKPTAGAKELVIDFFILFCF